MDSNGGWMGEMGMKRSSQPTEQLDTRGWQQRNEASQPVVAAGPFKMDIEEGKMEPSIQPTSLPAAGRSVSIPSSIFRRHSPVSLEEMALLG